MTGNDPNTAAIALRDVAFAYVASRPVFNDHNLTIRPGERVGLAGSNGEGKTTMLHLIMGLLRPQRGEIHVLGQSRRSEPDFRDVRRHVGLLFQDSDDQLFCPTVYEDVAFGPLNLGHDHAGTDRVVRETLAELELEGYESRITYRLSQGEKRLVALATVLAMKPRVLLLDEPTAGLDDKHQTRLVEILVRLPQEMLIISHDRGFLQSVATSHALLQDGTIHPA
jgi:cobalt/nickel transport system ATP-binding protein